MTTVLSLNISQHDYIYIHIYIYISLNNIRSFVLVTTTDPIELIQLYSYIPIYDYIYGVYVFLFVLPAADVCPKSSQLTAPDLTGTQHISSGDNQQSDSGGKDGKGSINISKTNSGLKT